MNEMNGRCALRLADCMGSSEGWGREQGRGVNQKLLSFVEQHPEASIFRVSILGVNRVDISFASETIVELARRFRGRKGFCFIDLTDKDMTENWEAAAQRKDQPIMIWVGDEGRPIGVEPTRGCRDAFAFALARTSVRAAEYAAVTEGMSIANVSTKFKQLWEQGFLLRKEGMAESGGTEYVYHRIK